jgi:hypothetical protein
LDNAPFGADFDPVDPGPMDVNILDIPVHYRDFADVFSKARADILPDKREFDCGIDLVDGKLPAVRPIYSLSPAEQAAQQLYLEEMLEKGFIRPSKSPLGFPQFFVKRRDSALRPCVDYRGLNAVTIKDRTPLPLINDLFDQTQGAKIFTKIDLRGAYNLVRIREGDEWKTAFRTSRGSYEYLVMPFGLTNAPAVFQRLMNHIMADIVGLYCGVFMDDILVFSKDETEHIKHVREILSRLRKHHLYVKFEKCLFHKDSVPFLGFIVSKAGISADPEKVRAIVDWKIPRSVRQVQSFLGLANYYRRFVPRFSTIALPLTNLTKKGVDYKWTDECQRAFNSMKKILTSAPVLTMANPNQPFFIHTDASSSSLGACLSQENETAREIRSWYSSAGFTFMLLSSS